MDRKKIYVVWSGYYPEEMDILFVSESKEKAEELLKNSQAATDITEYELDRNYELEPNTP